MQQRSNRWRMRASERRTILLIGDIAAVSLALIIALVAWGQRDWLNVSWSLLIERIPVWFFLLPGVWLMLSVELYETRRAGRRAETVKGVAITAGVMLVIYLFVFFLAPQELPRVGVGVFVAAAVVLILAWRFTYIAIFTQPDFLRRVLVVGAGRGGSTLAKIVVEMWPHPFYIIGFIDDDPTKLGITVEGFPVLGGSGQLLEILEREKISDVIFAISNEMRPELLQALLQAEESGIEITTMPIVYEQLMGRVPISLLQSDWILRSFFDQAHANSLYEMVKRVLDILGGLVGTAVYLFLYPFIAVLVLIDSGRPVLYHQTRLGQNGQEYEIIKFRTMGQDSEKDGKARVTVENDMRITRVGKLLRKSHLDEIPQFVNVLRGDMSLVGPRAERAILVNNLQLQVPFYRARLLVKPGITGWAQVNFGYAATVEDTLIKLEYDLYYIKHRTLMLDLVILLRTVGTVVGFKGQ
jgi:exopolysaccharide biosynthesis polyprenyl glycosylphosphotransferase